MNKMIKIIVGCLIFSAIALPIFAETNTVNVFPTDVQMSVRMQEAQLWSSQVVTVLRGIVGSFNEGITVTGDQLIRFSETSVGKTVMFIAFWKIVGSDIFLKILAVICYGLLMTVFVNFIKSFLCGKNIITDDGTKKEETYLDSIFFRMWEANSDSALGAGCILILFLIVVGVASSIAFKVMF